MQALVDKYSIHSPHRGTKLSPDAIVNRILFPLVNEGFKILEDGVASDPSKIDIIYLYGYGWPAWRGMLVSSHPALIVVYVSSH
jgi:3-hydroxyacyl-CoA dehydrogenase